MAVGVDGQTVVDEMVKLGITHVICVPDTFQKTVISLLAARESPKLHIVCTEDEAVGINAGLYVGGQNPMMVIQNNGIFASINTLKAIAFDAKVPTLMMVGQFQRDVGKTIEEQTSRAVRMLEPTLDTWGIPNWRIEGPGDLGVIQQAYRRAHADRGPAAVIVGAPTT